MPVHRISHWSKLEAFEVNKFSVAEFVKFIYEGEDNTVAKQ